MASMFPRIPFWLSVPAVIGVGWLGLFLLNSGANEENVVRVEVGGALVSGVVLSVVFLLLERRIEQAVTETQTREQYQLALAMERDLTCRDFSGLNLAETQLRGRDLTDSRLLQADLQGAGLMQSVLTNATLIGANLSSANLVSAKLGGANLWGANLARANLTGVDLTGADIQFSYLVGADTTDATLTNVDLSKADLGNATRPWVFLTPFLSWTGQREVLLGNVAWDPANPPKWPEGYDPPENAWFQNKRHLQ